MHILCTITFIRQLLIIRVVHMLTKAEILSCIGFYTMLVTIICEYYAFGDVINICHIFSLIL